MTDTEFMSKEASKLRAAAAAQRVAVVPAITETLEVPGSAAHPDWLPIPAAAGEECGEFGAASQPRLLRQRLTTELRAGDRLEQTVWIALSLCSTVTTLYAAYCFLFRD